MTVVQGKEKGVHTKNREGKKEFLQKNKDKKDVKDYLAKKRKYSRGIIRDYRSEPGNNIRGLFAIGNYFDNFPKKKVSEKLDNILTKKNPITEKERNSPLLGIIYGLLKEILTTERLAETYPNPKWIDATNKLGDIKDYSRNDGEEYIAMLTRHHLQSEEEENTSVQNIYK